MMKKMNWISLLVILAFTSCEKDNTLVKTTDPVGNYVLIPPVAPPTTATDSSMLLGNPSNATNNQSNISEYLIKQGYYTVSYNRDAGRPNWCSWHVGITNYGSVPRQNNFRENPDLPEGWYKVGNQSYTGSGFDRGHLCPSQDWTTSIEANSSTFLMTNIVPQNRANNQTWSTLELYCRQLVEAGKELYVIAGGYGEGGTGTTGFATTIDNGRVAVPANLWKVIVVLSEGADDLRRVKPETRVISVIMPNGNNVNTDWRFHRVTVDMIEQETGYDLLSKVSTSTQTVIEARVDNE